ncbi:MAG: serine protease [Gemmatimonadales bacterium]
MSLRSRGLAVAAMLCSLATPGRAQTSAEIFGRYAERVVKVQVSETGSGGKASLGTAFFVSADGRLITNYHVVAAVVREPDRYEARWLDQAGTDHPATVLDIDVVSDLALLDTGASPAGFFALGSPPLPKGIKLYSLGHPQDLGLSIVEGTYNGLLEHTLYPKIHFTGPLNPGMSGGPALLENGTVVGVNVATGGNSVSFLVPAAAARELVERVERNPPDPDRDLLEEAGRQLLANQERYLARLFADDAHPIRLGPFELPTQPADFFRCWGDADRDPDTPYERVIHRCSTDDYLYLTENQSSGIVTLAHTVLTSRRLNPARFYSLYSAVFTASAQDDALLVSDDLGGRQCHTGNLKQGGMVLRTIFCVRAYRRFPGLYDASVTAAALGARDVGVVSSLEVSGVSFPNAERIAREFLSRLRWAPR